MIPYNISDLSLTFFTKGRPWDVPADNPNFIAIRDSLLSGTADPDEVVRLADTRIAIQEAAPGVLEVRGHEVYWNDQPIHGVWVEKILKFKDQGLPFDPIFLALQDLMKNPTPAAIERLPIFVEQSKLGFTPDGRICGFKYVRNDFRDKHSGTVLYSIGSTVSMPRERCDANPDQECSTGLHVGALEYVKGFGGGNDRLLLVAFWPHNAVAVPRDYGGQKLRVCEMDVLEELDRSAVDDFLNSNQTVVQVKAAEPPKPPAWKTAVVGDVVVQLSDLLGAGVAKVVAIDPEEDSDTRLKLEDEDCIKAWVDNDDVIEIVTDSIFLKIKEGDRVRIQGDHELEDGIYRVETVDLSDGFGPKDTILTVWDDEADDSFAVYNEAVKEIVTG